MSKIAVFVPVYNEEAYLAKTISTILAQDHTDFDLLVSENHSTDGTLDILRDLEAKDSRIKVLRPEKKLNSYGNFCFLVDHLNSHPDYPDVQHPHFWVVAAVGSPTRSLPPPMCGW